MRVSFITTVFNEEETIEDFLKSLFAQTRLPDEIIIVDGGSRDGTTAKIKVQKSRQFGGQAKIKDYKGKFNLITKRGNRSVGRNEAIRQATGDVIVCSDSGNILDKDWVKNIIKPFSDKKTDVAAGFYKANAENIFQKCLVPFALVMPDRVKEDEFLPATRSIAFRKTIWEKAGGFNEQLSHNEDYAFALKLRNISAKIVFCKNAIVNWIPRRNFKEAFVMFFRFALGDAEAKISRNSVLLLFARYVFGFYFLFLCLLYRSLSGFLFLVLLIFIYLIWSINKNFKYVKDKKAYIILPLLQLTADIAVISGTFLGMLKRAMEFNLYVYIKNNKFLFTVIAIYIVILISTIKYGIPNQNHPFPYHMDEWHQLQAVANTFRYGTPNTFGSANGTMFHFLYTGFYLVPFTLIGYINPFELRIDNWQMREKVFEVLRIQSIIFGVISILILYKISELINISKRITVLVFTFTPIWIMLSGYFKYDIALIFWIIMSILFFIRFAKSPSNRSYILAAIPSSLAIAVKISAGPLFILYILAYFLFHPLWKKNLRYFLAGIAFFLVLLVLFGFPDTLFGKGNINYYLYNNIIESRQNISNLQLGMDPIYYLFIRHYPLVFGYGLTMLFVISLFLLSYFSLKKGLRKMLNYKIELFIFVSFLNFFLSLLTININSAGNRTLVILPFLALLIGIVYKKISAYKNIKLYAGIIITLVVFIQIYESWSWVHRKTAKSTQEASSVWVQKNVPKNTVLGLENIPIYQGIPDIMQKEFYFDLYKIRQNKKYNYQIINNKSKSLPKIIVLTNDEVNKKLFKETSQKDLLKRMSKEKYKRITVIKLEFDKDFKFNASDEDFILSGLVASPVSVSIYEKAE